MWEPVTRAEPQRGLGRAGQVSQHQACPLAAKSATLNLSDRLPFALGQPLRQPASTDNSRNSI